jgi:hypothetical protein
MRQRQSDRPPADQQANTATKGPRAADPSALVIGRTLGPAAGAVRLVGGGLAVASGVLAMTDHPSAATAARVLLGFAAAAAFYALL